MSKQPLDRKEVLRLSAYIFGVMQLQPATSPTKEPVSEAAAVESAVKLIDLVNEAVEARPSEHPHGHDRRRYIYRIFERQKK